MEITIPIPSIPDVVGWGDIPIVDTVEPLVSLEGLSEKIVVKPYYGLLKIPNAIQGVYVREKLAELLLETTKKLPVGMKWIVFDGWRPLEVQTHLYEDLKTRVKLANPALTQDEISAYVSKYVSMPNDNYLMPSPHLTGGAIDLGLLDKHGNLLEMGTPFDDFTEKSHTRYYEVMEKARGKIDEESKKYQLNRRFQYYLLTEVGFTNYNQEWWHYDFGNQFWARVKNEKYSIYGKTHL
jgi:zinc D-Ala-D-Ala dipeptidase